MRRLFTSLLFVGLLLTGCSHHVEMPPDDAGPVEVTAAFLEASKHLDKRAGKHLSGDCWDEVDNWFGDQDRTISYDVADPPSTDVTPESLTTKVSFMLETKLTSPSKQRWFAELRREDNNKPWRICHFSNIYS